MPGSVSPEMVGGNVISRFFVCFMPLFCFVSDYLLAVARARILVRVLSFICFFRAHVCVRACVCIFAAF